MKIKTSGIVFFENIPELTKKKKNVRNNSMKSVWKKYKQIRMDNNQPKVICNVCILNNKKLKKQHELLFV